jgi:hypothetical protein
MALCGCSSSSQRHSSSPAPAEGLLSISGELSLSNISFHYSIVNHNTNVIDKDQFSLTIQDANAPKITPDNNGAFAFAPVAETNHAIIFAQNKTHPNLIFEAMLFKNQTLTGAQSLNISLKSTAASLIARHLKENLGQMLDPSTITDAELTPTAEAIAYILEKRPDELTSPLPLIPTIKEAYTKAALAIFNAKRGTTLAEHCILLYLAGDNDLHGAMRGQLEALAGKATYENVPTIAFADLYEKGARIFKLENGKLIELEKLNSIDSSKPQYLKDFVEKYRRLYPAKGYTMCIGSHGNAWRPADAARGWLLEDSNTGAALGSRGELISVASYLTASVKTFTGDVRPFSLLVLDACQMGLLEVAYEFKNACEHLIFSQANLPGAGMPLYALVGSGQENDAKKMGFSLCEQFKKDYVDKRVASTISMLDMSKLESFTSAFDTFLGDVIGNGRTYTHAFGEIASSSASLNPDGSTNEYVLQPFNDIDYRDLGHLMELVHGTVDNPQLAAAWVSCDVAKASYGQLIQLRHQYGYRDATGLAITFPLKSVYESEYVGNSPKYHKYFELNYCRSSKWAELLSKM